MRVVYNSRFDPVISLKIRQSSVGDNTERVFKEIRIKYSLPWGILEVESEDPFWASKSKGGLDSKSAEGIRDQINLIFCNFVPLLNQSGLKLLSVKVNDLDIKDSSVLDPATLEGNEPLIIYRGDLLEVDYIMPGDDIIQIDYVVFV